jgi:hypothetical protein
MAILNIDAAYVTLDAGVSTTAVNAATGTGTAASQPFTVQPRVDGSARTVSFQAIPTGTFTALTANLEASSDGGTTWNTYTGGATLNFQTTPWEQVAGLVAGIVYRLNIASFTGGTSVVINASAS